MLTGSSTPTPAAPWTSCFVPVLRCGLVLRASACSRRYVRVCMYVHAHGLRRQHKSKRAVRMHICACAWVWMNARVNEASHHCVLRSHVWNPYMCVTENHSPSAASSTAMDHAMMRESGRHRPAGARPSLSKFGIPTVVCRCYGWCRLGTQGQKRLQRAPPTCLLVPKRAGETDTILPRYVHVSVQKTDKYTCRYVYIYRCRESER